MTETIPMLRTPIRALPAALALLSAACSTAPEPAAPAAEASAEGPHCPSGSFDVYFSEWEADLNDASRALLASAQEKLAGCVIEHVSIVGMADASGDYNSNLEIS